MKYEPEDFDTTNERITKALIYGVEVVGMITALLLAYIAVGG